ncbi:hypothetical protein ACFRIB_52945 [Streptomyces mirabilis]|uniref:hypothetical protein n=1 Tax=Streptomyces mirabilis TaxID=68239 RepID=UPI00367DAA67
MRTSTDDLTPQEMRTVAGEALALLRQLGQGDVDETGQRARWIAALEVLAAATPHEIPEDSETLSAVTHYLALLGRSSLSPSITDGDAIEEDAAGWAELPDDDCPEDRHPTAQELGEDCLGLGDDFGVGSPPTENTAGQGESEGDSDSQKAGLMELKGRLQQANVEAQKAQQEVSAGELDVLQSSYSREAMQAARQIEVEERKIQLDMRRLDMNERDSDRRYALERRTLEMQHEQRARELEVERERTAREFVLGERNAEIEEARRERELVAQQQASARQQATLQLTVGASAITVTSWLVFPGAGAGLSLLALSPFLGALGVLFLLTAMALSRTRATRSTEVARSGTSWTDGVRAVPLLPVTALLVATSAVFAFISVLAPKEQRKQLNGYAHRTLHTAERILLGR